MLELAFTVCMISSPSSCEERSLLFVDVSPMQCILGAQTVLAPWSRDHPGWTIDSYTRQYVDTRISEI